MRRLLLVLLLLSGATAVVEGIVPCDVADLAPECYVALRPGPTEDALGLIEIADEPVTDSAGQLVLTTVLVQSDLDLGDIWELRNDPTSRRVDRSLYFPDDVDEDVTREQFSAQMTESTQAAAVAALRELGYELDPTGARVAGVLDDGPSAEVIEDGEVVVGLDGAEITTVDSLVEALDGLAPGDTIPLEVETLDGEVTTREVTLASNPQDESRPFLGLLLVTRIDVPLDIDIDAGSIGGPSAGLMFALSIVDLLTEEDLTGGRVIAGTGEIGIDGRVGPIGGIVHKIPGSILRDDDEPAAEVFLVPRDNVEEARGAVVTQPITLVPVDTLGDAVDALAALRAGERPDGAFDLTPNVTAAPTG